MKIIFLSIVSLCLTSMSLAQIEVGVRAGVTSIDLADNLVITSLTEQGLVSISPADADYGYHFGLYTRLSIAGFYLEPALLFNASSMTYRVRQVSEDGVIETLRAETYRDIDIPFVVGIKKSIFRFYGGPVASFHLDSTSDLLSLDGYRQNFDQSTFGFRVGTGLDIWRLRLDLGYEGSLSRFGDHVNIGGRDFAFDDQPGRLLASVGVRF